MCNFLFMELNIKLTNKNMIKEKDDSYIISKIQ
jgi:hypothetical protein